MKYLVYCILRNRAAPAAAGGEDGVSLVVSGNLAAAISACPPETAEPPTSRLLAYESVISRLHSSGAVIPLRYGCRIENESHAARLLDERREEYEALLDRLADQVEIGLRTLWDAPAEIPASGTPAGPGASWLAGIRRRHGADSHLTEGEREWAGRVCAALSSLHSEVRMEARPASPEGDSKKSRVVSLYFLVPRNAERQLRDTLGRIVSSQDRRFLISGPWPPYNFVMQSSSTV